jgi:hypothetical protein
MWRPRDRERYVGGYDPEHEMPDPDREPGDRWQSGAYRHNARDTRFAYRMNPDAFERQFEGDRGGYGYDRGGNWDRDARDMNRDRGDYDRGSYGGGYRGTGNYFGSGGYRGGNDYDRGGNPDFDRMNRFGGSDRGGWDRDRDRGSYGYGSQGSGGGYGGGYGGGAYDRARGYDRDRYGSDRYGSDRYGSDRGSSMSGPHFDRFSSDRGRDHDRWNSGGRASGFDDFRPDDWRRRR